MRFIGREKEQIQLRAWYESSAPEFIAVYGRRRVGKTFLVREFFNNEFCFQVTGMENSGLTTQLQNFHVSLMRAGHTGYEPATTWFDAFEHLIDLLESKPASTRQVLFFDEMPWMDTPRSGFLPALEHFWNSWASARQQVLLIVCGSATAWITNKLLRNKGGLYNRVTGRILLEPFTLGECEKYFREHDISLSRYQIVENYMVFGGVPYYLSLMDKRLGPEQNIDLLCFSKNAALKREYRSVFDSLFKHPERYLEVIGALATKGMGLTRKEIVVRTSLSDGGGLVRMLDELEQCGFIRKYFSFGKKAQDALYQLSDAFTLFHCAYMQDGSNNDEDFWLHYSKRGAYYAWSGHAFEQVCLFHIRQIKRSLGIGGVLTRYSTWRSKSYEPGAQIDLVIDRSDGTVNLCEMKFSNDAYVIDSAYEQTLRNKRSAFEHEAKTRKGTHLTLVTTYGMKRNKYSGIIQSEVTMNDLFEG